MLDRHYLHDLAPGYDRNQVLNDLMTEYGEDVWNFAFFLTRRSDAADDISQDAFLAAYKQLYAFRGDCTVKSWLLGITRNKSLNYLRNAFIRKVTLLETVRPPSGSSPSAEDITFKSMEAKQLWTRVMQLPIKFREVIILDYHYGLSIKQIAELLGISEGTVKSRENRAKRKMAAMLNHEREGG
ncbi:RNA polymerase sigma factor [Paenibacillus spongiae]|uniref:Sigma-70 family RNA polymerase sigma factor n=1 Tax=Paenibacillus spongiae TaxID=2909671 RepID=A0ABY5SGX3_9BACL|nr:sigma-70 family RNA polymerase sigma factor [Paenibacillus spongiae]UVI32720.1 sigma-70 family RNA polymerase sigma factor [Paenibacillus spongiae]